MDRITVYVPEELHRRLKVAASQRGLSLSDFMLRAAEHALQVPDRAHAARRMDAVRESVRGSFTAEDIRGMRDEGRR